MAPGTPSPRPPLHLLVVDDSAMMRLMVRRTVALSGLEATVFEAADGREALEVMAGQRIDALFTDLNMPGMSGMELLQTLADDPAHHDLVRVIISTDGSDARRAATAALGVSHYLGKPVRPEAMRDVLAAVVQAL